MRAEAPTLDVTYEYRRTGKEFRAGINLYWEVYCDPVSDDYYDTDDPREIWAEWRRRYPTDEGGEARWGSGAFRIWWFVSSTVGHFEGAPLCEDGSDNWQKHYTHPLDASTGSPISWMGVPVADKLWRPGNAQKGGFIQEVSGWKPSPLQEFVDVRKLDASIGYRP